MSQARPGCGSEVCIGLDSGADLFRNWHRAKTAGFRIALNAHSRDCAGGNADLATLLRFRKLKLERYRPSPELAHADANFDDVLKTQRVPVFAFRLDAGPAESERLRLVHREADRTIKGVFGGLHETEEIREMHDAGHVRLKEFDHARRAKFITHRTLIYSPP